MSDTNVRIILEVVDKNAAKNTQNISKGLSAAKVAVAAFTVAAAKMSFDFLKSSALMAARAETLGVVTRRMGENAGYSASQIDGFEKSIQSMGITTIASREAVAALIRANIDLSNASDLARLAQNAAVIAGEDSSQSFKALSTIIATGNTLMARRRGLMVDFVGAYKELAAQLGKSVDELTDAERSQARLNEVMDKGESITGVYEAAMETAGKKAQSFKRHADELKVALGESLLPVYGDLIDATTELTKGLTENIKFENRFRDEFGTSMTDARHAMIGNVNIMDDLVSKMLEREQATRRAAEMTAFFTVEIDDLNDSVEETPGLLDGVNRSIGNLAENARKDLEFIANGGLEMQFAIENAIAAINAGDIDNDFGQQLMLDAELEVRNLQGEFDGMDLNQIASTIAEDLGIPLSEALTLAQNIDGVLNTINRKSVSASVFINEYRNVLSSGGVSQTVIPTGEFGSISGATNRGGFDINSDNGIAGSDFVVPQGYSGDGYKMNVSSGEHVTVTPQGQSRSGDNSDILSALEDMKMVIVDAVAQGS
jgi:hypothetical protein